MEKIDKKRASNWTQGEKAAAVERVIAWKDVLFGRFRGASCGGRQKDEAWQSIADALNASGDTTCTRTAAEVKKMFQNTKTRAKEKHGQVKKTGGGPTITYTPAEDLVISNMTKCNAPSLGGLVAGLDSLEAEPEVEDAASVTEENTETRNTETSQQVTNTQTDSHWNGLEKVRSRKRHQEDRERLLYTLEEKRVKLEIQRLEVEINAAERRHVREEELHALNRSILAKTLVNLDGVLQEE